MTGTPRAAASRLLQNRLFLALCLACTSVAVLALAVLLASVLVQGVPGLRWDFFTAYASRKPERAGILAPLAGSIWVCATCMLLSLPLGVATAVYLEEFARRSRLNRFIELNVRNLAGVPSIVYGIIGLTAFGRMFGLVGAADGTPVVLGDPESFFHLELPLGQSVLAGGLTLMLVILPIMIIASQEALRAVPRGLRQSSLALGATPWQTTWQVTLPAAAPTILTGAILAMSRAVGEAAPLLVLGIPLFIASTPESLMDPFTVLPFQIYSWASRPQAAFHDLAASGIIVLLAVLLSFNALAIYLRIRLQRSSAP
ncbi:MAG: phosphate transporter, permease protein PstA [Planctomycetota bacterium]|jgi:phosphate transport system permease protein